ncbi:MAG: flavodoxin family protein [Deltaproteobacteria bacterium]|nr:flavodoxin family protein [Deltaproteobacteria bacterium]
MRVTTLLGSAKKKGNTATILSWIEEEMKSLRHDVEHIVLNDKKIGGCLGCAKCKDSPDEIACVQKDDAIGIMENMVSSDVVLYASPIYFWGFSSQMKTLIDRCYSLVTNYHRPGHTSLMRGKRIGLLVTGGGPYENNVEGLFTAFNRIADFLLAEKSGELYIGGCTTPDELSESTREKAVELARSLVS